MKRTRLNPIGRRAKREAEISAPVLDELRAAADGRCQRCEGWFPRLDVHHLLKRSLGGKTTGDNIVMLCRGCHSAIHEQRCSDWRRWLNPNPFLTGDVQ